jgi:hypothetical protein
MDMDVSRLVVALDHASRKKCSPLYKCQMGEGFGHVLKKSEDYFLLFLRRICAEWTIELRILTGNVALGLI